jgi:hypothetical protein
MYKIIGADGKEYGPVATEQLRQWIADRRANAQTMVQAEGTQGWQPLSSIVEFADALSKVSSPALASSSNPPGLPPGTATPEIPTYLWQSIVVTICCCPPFGIPAIVYSAQVSSKLAAGDIPGAQAASNKAKMWFWISFAVGALLNIISIIVFMSGGLLGTKSRPW